MREKELRIALVCFGGVSLAVYMHGISKEILKLVHASSSLHSIGDRTQRSKASFFDKVDSTDSEYDTEAVYFDMLREIGRTIELRVTVDIIAGASAGGINGTMLARALSHDLPIGALRDLWLKHADVKELLAPDARAGTKPWPWNSSYAESSRKPIALCFLLLPPAFAPRAGKQKSGPEGPLQPPDLLEEIRSGRRDSNPRPQLGKIGGGKTGHAARACNCQRQAFDGSADVPAGCT